MKSPHLPAAFVLVLPLTGGCALLPPNNLRLIKTDPVGQSPGLVHFTRGTHVRRSGQEAILLASSSAALLFDVKGRQNRFELMLQEGPQHILYERIGQRRQPLVNAADAAPPGIHLHREGRELRGHVDVFVCRGDEDPYDPHFEHYPRALRVVGYLVVPSPATDDAETVALAGQLLAGRSSAKPVTQPDAPLADPRMSLDKLKPGPALEQADQRLRRLPIIDVKMLVPSTVAERVTGSLDY